MHAQSGGVRRAGTARAGDSDSIFGAIRYKCEPVPSCMSRSTQPLPQRVQRGVSERFYIYVYIETPAV